MSYVGTLEWAHATEGVLRRRDRARLIGQAVAAQLVRLPSQWRSRILGEHSSLTSPTPPDSVLAREADERVRELSSPALYGHCARTWAYAALFAERDRVAHDAELLYLACMLHDLGLTKPHWGRDPHAQCFAVEGAYAARAFVGEHGASGEQANAVAQAISLHLNVTVPARLGTEAQLLSKGVSLDVVGRRLHQIPARATQGVEQRWPRGALASELIAATAKQARLRPRSRSALLHSLGFPKLIEGNPLEHARAGGSQR
ncbi:MAG TPA: HD domain-containing protein [Solirubrobacteraceae bacterium]|jgi:hypothetical protein|nr:HD domain-containing protein [Solirubrobacteraceae bacterium]